MADESILKVECAKLQSNIKLMEDDLAQLESSLERAASANAIGRDRLIEQERRRFESMKADDLKRISDICANMRLKVDEFLDTFPELESKEYSGKYEVKEVEAHLAEVYPQSLLDNYICARPIEFDDESEAYAAYAYVERRVAQLKAGSLAGSLHTKIVGSLEGTMSREGLMPKVLLGLFAVLTLSFIFSPLLYLGLFSVVGISAAVNGAVVNTLFRNLYSVKLFLNNAYDEDIFQDEKSEIMDNVSDFLDETKEEYSERVRSRQFVMNPKLLADYDANAEAAKRKLEASILAKRQALEATRQKASELLAELDAAMKAREQLAQGAYAKYLGSVDWKHEWMDSLLLDVTADKRVIGCKWLKANTLYYGKKLEQLQAFLHLAAYQGVLRMHPTFANQVCIDYQHMGRPLIPFSKLLPVIFTLCTSTEEIDKKWERIDTDIRARTNTVLQSCASLEDFNKLMSTYNVPGESYVVVHLCGLRSISQELKLFLHNGPRVGYFFKLYLTLEELNEVAKDFPFDSFEEYAEVTDLLVPRTAAQVRRIITPST